MIEFNENLKENENDNKIDYIEPSLTKETKKENKNFKNYIVLFVCAGMLASGIIGGLIGANINKPTTTSNIYVSDFENNRAEIIHVEGNKNALTTSQIYEKNINSIVYIQTEITQNNIFGQVIKGASAGSGFIVSEDGYIITNYHVIDGANSIKISMANDKEYNAKLVGYEEENDIAVLKIDSTDVFTPVILGDSDKTIVGEDVVAIGNPLGELTYSLTKGVVSGFDRNIYLDNYTEINMFQVDCALNEGNSGGPIFNMYGEVIGVVSAKYASETIEGLGFCIPISDVINILPDLIENGKVMNKAYFGISATDVTEDMISQLSLVKGAYVSVVEKDSCAETAGIKIGDIIVEIDGEKIESVSNLISAKRDYKAGDTAELKIWRGGDYVNLTVVFDEYDEEKVKEVEEENKKTEEEMQKYYDMYDFWNYANNKATNDSSMEDMEEFFNYFFGR